MKELITMENGLDYQAINLGSLQDGISLNFNYESRKEEMSTSQFKRLHKTSADMVLLEEIEIKEEPIEHIDTTEFHESNENGLVPTTDYVQGKDNEYFKFYKDNENKDNLNKSNIKTREIKGSDQDLLNLPQNISNFKNISRRKCNNFFTEKTQCVIPLDNGFSQFTVGDNCGTNKVSKELQTLDQPVTTGPMITATSQDSQTKIEVSKGNREDLIAQAVNSVLSSLKAPKPNMLQLTTSNSVSTLEHPSDPLRKQHALDSINFSQSANKRPIRTSNKSAKLIINDSLTEENYPQSSRKKDEVHKSKETNDQSILATSNTNKHVIETANGFQRQIQNNKLQNQGLNIKIEPQISETLEKEDFGWNWETNSNNFENKNCHSQKYKDRFSISDDYNVQESNINNVTNRVVSIQEIKKENNNYENDISIESNSKSNCMETFSIKPKVRKKRIKWTPGEDGMYACNLCSYKAKKAPCFKRHIITHAIDKPYSCHICNKGLCSENSLRMHLEIHNGIKNYHCSLCNKSFRQKVHLKYHMNKHHKESNMHPTQCVNINDELQLSRTLNKINSILTGSEIKKNDFNIKPEYEGQSPASLKKISNNEYMKDVKLDNSRANSDLQTGIKKEHFDNSLMNDTDLDPSNIFNSINKSPDKNNKISKEKHMSDPEQKDSDSLKKKHICHICNKSLSTYNSLKMHLEIHNGIKKYHCSVCDKSFRQKGHLKIHVSKHYKENNKQPNKAVNNSDTSIIYSERDTNNSFIQPVSEKEDPGTLKVISNRKCFNDVEIDNSRSASNLIADSIMDPFSDPLRITNDSEIKKTLQSINKSPDTNAKIFNKKHFSDSVIEECDVLEKTKYIKSKELATNYNNDHRPDYHSPDDKDEFSISVENEVQNDSIKRISEKSVLTENLKKEVNNLDDNGEDNRNKVIDDVNFFSRKHRGKKVRNRKNQRWVPGKDGMYKCNLCNYKAKRAPYLKKHLITHTNEKPYKCHLCDKRFNHFNSLKYHLDVHNDIIHGIRKYHCHLCEYSFIQKGHLKSHILQHSREERDQCLSNRPQNYSLGIKEETIMLDRDKNRSSIESISSAHNKQHLEGSSYDDVSKGIELNDTRLKNIKKYGLMDSSIDSLMNNNDLDTCNTSQNMNNSHCKSYKMLEGKHIDVSFAKEYDLLIKSNIEKNNEQKVNNNRQSCHLPEVKDKISITEENRDTNIQMNNANLLTEEVPVENIKKKNILFEDSVNVDKDILSSHRETFSIKRKKKKVYRWIAGEDGMFSCNLCSYKAKQAPYLKRHLKTHLTNKPYKCHICVKSFCGKNSLKMHLDMHNGVKNYHCSLCDHSFIQKIHLKMHMLRHTGEKKYKCEHCEKKFGRPEHLRMHLATHSDERPWACTQCDLKFKNKSNLYHHIRNHANDRKYKCQECDAAFMLSNTLRNHLASHLVFRKGCKICPECPLFFWAPSQFISHLSKRHGYSTEVSEQILKKFISETSFRFYKKNKKNEKIVSKKLQRNFKPVCENDTEISIKEEVKGDSKKFNPTFNNSKTIDGSKESINKVDEGDGFGSKLFSSMDLNQPIMTCTNRQVLRSSTDSKYLVITYNANPKDEIKNKEYFKFVKEDQGSLTIGHIQKRFISYHNVETKIVNGHDNLDC